MIGVRKRGERWMRGGSEEERRKVDERREGWKRGGRGKGIEE